MNPRRAPVSREPVIPYQRKDTYSLPASAFNNLARPSINHTSLEPAPESTVQNTPKASPYCNGNDAEDLLLPSPATPTLDSISIAEDLFSNRRIGRAERHEDHGRQSDYESTSKPRYCPHKCDTTVGAWWYLAEVPRCKESWFTIGEYSQFGGECICSYGSIVAFPRQKNWERSLKSGRGPTSLFQPPANRYRKPSTRH